VFRPYYAVVTFDVERAPTLRAGSHRHVVWSIGSTLLAVAERYGRTRPTVVLEESRASFKRTICTIAPPLKSQITYPRQLAALYTSHSQVPY
jgi:hypothetical protein